jgi:hypothetical protein
MDDCPLNEEINEIIVNQRHITEALDLMQRVFEAFEAKLVALTERVEKIEGYDNPEQFRMTSDDTAHIGPWTTVRACIDCGVLITGGRTRCLYCVGKLQG